MKYKSFEDMQVWKDALGLAVRVFEWSESLPKKEDYGLTSQVRISALSVSANIAKGFGRHHVADRRNFYYNAHGSLCETRNHLVYAQRVKYLDEDLEYKFRKIIDDVTVDLGKLISSLTAMKGK